MMAEGYVPEGAPLISPPGYEDPYNRPPLPPPGGSMPRRPPRNAPKKKSSGNFLMNCLTTACGILLTCCCCGCACAVFILLLLLGPIGWAIMGGSVLIFIITLVAAYCLHQFVIEDTHFTLFNYFVPFLKYALTSQFKGEEGVRQMWKDMGKNSSSGNPYIAEGMGPNTYTFFGWREAAEMLSSWGERIRNGSMRRHNELGTALMGSGPWPETGTIALGYSNEEHAVARPYIGRAIDGSQVQEGVMCNGSNGWNRQYLRQFWRDRFATIDSFNTSDVGWWCSIVLHKIHVNMDLTDEEAQSFMNWPSCMSFPGAGKVGVGLGNITERELCLIKYCTPVPCFQCSRQEHVDDLKDAIQAKWPADDWSDEKLVLVANMFMDSLQYAGGLSVPSVLMNMLAWWFKTSGRPAELDRVTAQDENSIKDFMWEAMRRNPPVAGVPRWVSNDGGFSWTHEVANVEQAMQDDRVFPDATTFKMGRPGLNAQDYSKSMFWADFAIVNNDTCHPDSHLCPGKQLSQELIVAFWQEFLLNYWETDADTVDIGYNLTSTFELTKSSEP